MSVTQFGIINTCWFEYAECTLTIPTYVGVDPWGFVEWREVLCDFLANYCTLCTKINNYNIAICDEWECYKCECDGGDEIVDDDVPCGVSRDGQ